MNNYKLIFYDFEVFQYDWMVVLIDYESKEKTIIIDDKNKLQNFYESNKNNIWIGFNSRTYDQFILKGILSGLNPTDVNNAIIIDGRNGYQVVPNADKYQLYNFDIMIGFNGLKQLEGFMGSMIKETSIPFDIGRKLTSSEIEEVIKYCTHDVEQTIEVFNNRREEFDSQVSLIDAFNLPMEMFTKTKAQLSATVLGAKRSYSRNDDFDITIPDTLQISEKYKYIVDWYKDVNNRDYKKLLNTDVAGVPHVFAWGGIHGARLNYKTEGIIACCDVASLYPSIMIEYNYLSRNVTEPEKYKEIREKRLKLKKEKNPMQKPYKIVLNSTYGAMKDKHNDLFDPLMANNVCITGQLLLLDLIEKIEPYVELIQSNTDGLFMKVNDMETVDKIKSIASEWEKRVHLSLEWDIYSKIYQKDVNNYIMISSDGHTKTKGAYVKKLSAIDYNLPIINKSLINYFVSGKNIEDTIKECSELKEFQLVSKVSSKYKYGMYGNEKLNERVLRIFASTDPNAKGVFKVKDNNGENSIAKIPDTPEHCFLWNDSVNDVKCPEYLDKSYYINMAKKRLNDFMDEKGTKKNNRIESGIKGISQDIKDEVMSISEKEFNSFIDLLIYVTEESNINKTQLFTLIKLNYFSKYGGNLKLTKLQKVFNEGSTYCKPYKKTYCEKTKLDRIAKLKDYANKLENEVYPIKEQLIYESEVLGVPQSIYDSLTNQAWVTDIREVFNSKLVKMYGLRTGQMFDVKIKDNVYKDHDEILNHCFVKLIDYKVKPKYIKTENGFEIVPKQRVFWLTNYKVINY